MVVGTRVVFYNTEFEKPPLRVAQVGLSIMLAYGLIFLLMLPFNGLSSMFSGPQVT